MSYPISTNPKVEGLRFLAWDSDNKEWAVYYYDYGGWDGLSLVLYNDRHQECYAGDIVRWQPLPSDPELEEANKKAKVSVINANDLEVLNVRKTSESGSSYKSANMDDGDVFSCDYTIFINRTNNGLVN